ncbi:MAG: MotA/TolQ/ExbB proton channel family protein [Bacteroidales bacterium]|jgi:biopolymer transport protein ExbB|nr:MotA/TolQ/ExbB proton channel family protein [Bacteroidales bacterium]
MFKSILLNINAVSSAVAVGNEANVAVENAITTEKIPIMDLALQGGWVMLVLLALLILAVYISVERYLALSNALKDDSSQFMNNIRNYIHKGDIEGARALSKSTDSPIARMIDKGLSRLGRPLNDIQTAIENVGKLEVANLEKRISLVATVSSLGPMLGFLGTVTGMVTAFFDMANAGNNIDIQVLSSGIYEAMVTTVGGLIVGIIGYFLYNVLVTRINKVVFLLEARAMEFMDLLHEPA